MTPSAPDPDSRVLSSLLDPDHPCDLPPSQRAAVRALAAERDRLRSHANALDRNWEAVHEMAMRPIRAALGLPDGTVPELIEAIDRLRADLDATAASVLAVLDGREPETWAWPLFGLRDALAAARSEADRLREALRTIADWRPETFPRVADCLNPGRTISYGSAYGSNGERDFMRRIASAALARLSPLPPEPLP